MVRRAALALLAAPLAHAAEPGGADWAYDGGPERNTCASCHFDGAVERQSPALRLSGAGAAPDAQGRVPLVLSLRAPAAGGGFLLRASEGALAPQDPDIETRADAARSTAPRSPDKDGVFRWRFFWTPPAGAPRAAAFYAAANAANMDASPLGDTIYVSTFKTGAEKSAD